ncbi:MAG: TerB family tellurite resistance protein [Rhodoglobus sp.]|nr:TerB family tellurite resistance protein [Rhodoglobus sp.]
MTSNDLEQAYGRTLIALAAADVTGITENEKEMIDRLFGELGFAEETRTSAWNATRDTADVIRGLATIQDPVRRRALIKDLVLLAHADGEYTSEERAFIQGVNEAFGHRQEFVARVEDWVRRGDAWQQEGVDLCTVGASAS